MLNKRAVSLILILVMTLGGLVTGCGPNDPTKEDSTVSEDSTATAQKSTDEKDNPTSEETMGLRTTLEYNKLETQNMDTEEEAAAFLFDTNLNDALSESLFYMSTTDKQVFSDDQYPQQRQDLIEEIIDTSQSLEDSVLEALEVIDLLQATYMEGLTNSKLDLPDYYHAVEGVHSEYLATILDQSLKIDLYKTSSQDPYTDTWYKEMLVMTRLGLSVELSDYFLQLSLDLVTLQGLLSGSSDQSDLVLAESLGKSLDTLNEKAYLVEDVINTRLELISRLKALEEADEYYALAKAYAVIETADAAKALLDENFPEDQLQDDDKALIRAEIDYYVSLAQGFSDALIEGSEYGLVIPENPEAYHAGGFPVKLFGIAYADEASKAVQLKEKAGSTTQKVFKGLVSFGESFTDTVAEIGTGLFTATTNIVGKTADVAYGSVKGAFASLKLAVGIDDKDAFEEQIKSVKRMINGQPGEVARMLSSAATNLQKGIESKLGKVLGEIPLGNVIKKPLSFTVKGYTGLVSSLANAFDGKKPTTEKIMNLVHASTLYKADVLSGAKDMFMSVGKEEVDKLIPEKAKGFYEALQAIVKKVEVDKEALLNEAKKSVKSGFDQTQSGQKINGVIKDFSDKAQEAQNAFDEKGQEIVSNVVNKLVKTQAVENDSGVKIIQDAEKKLKSNQIKSTSDGINFDYMPNDMKLLLMGFEEELKAKAIKEVAEEIKSMKDENALYKGYLIKVTAGPFVEELGPNVATVVFDFKDSSVSTRFSIQGSNSMDSSSEIVFSSFEKNGDNISMSTSHSSIGPVSVSGILLDKTFTGTIRFTLQGQGAVMTFKAKLEE